VTFGRCKEIFTGVDGADAVAVCMLSTGLQSQQKIRKDLMDHDVGAGLDGLLWVTLVTIGTSFIHLHVVTALLLTLLFLIRLALALLFQVDLLAARLRSGILVNGRSSGFVGASHLGIFTFGRSSTLSLSFDLFLLLLLFQAVLVTVCGKVGLGLVRGELWWSRLLGIPVPQLARNVA